VETTNILVVKRSGARELFNRDKIRRGVLRACEKRPVPVEKIEMVLDRVEEQVKKRKKGEISSEQIGKIVMAQLRRLDKVAYIRFASVYLDFADPKDYQHVLSQITRKTP